jgi:hypothetical protein
MGKEKTHVNVVVIGHVDSVSNICKLSFPIFFYWEILSCSFFINIYKY